MCGFITLLARDGRRVEEARIQGALDTLPHRGPDERGSWVDPAGGVAMGHVRLGLVGLGNGQQPLADSAHGIHAVVNGEFYDHLAIRRELEQAGCVFRTESDSEIALHLYRVHGVAGLRRLRGEFAFVLHDAGNDLLLAVRDRFGIKPLFYTEHDGVHYFGSEVKALLGAGVPAVWDEEAYASRSFYLGDRTLFKGINSVPPGHWMMVTPGGVRQGQYWDLAFEGDDREAPGTEADMIRQVREAVEESVDLRLRADVPMSVYLSGGIDSSAMLGVASRLGGRPMDAFNLSFGEMEDYDEDRFARLAAEHNGARFHSVPVTQDDLADRFPTALWHNETPFFNAHGVAKYRLSELVREAGFKAVITGEGADEVFAGYPHFRRDMVLYNAEGQDPAEIDRLRERLRGNAQGYTQQGMPADVHWLTEQLGHGVSWLDNQAGWFTELEALYSSAMRERFGGVEPYRQFFDRVDHRRLENVAPVHRSMYLWAKSYLPNFVLTTLGDRMEMANSIEGRVPLLDHHVVEAVARMPVSMKVRGATEKYVFREAMRPYLPESLYARKKHYFRAPPATLLQQGRLYQLVQDQLRGTNLARLPFFEPRKVTALLDELPRMSRGRQALLDPLLMEITSLCLMQEQFGMSRDDGAVFGAGRAA